MTTNLNLSAPCKLSLAYFFRPVIENAFNVSIILRSRCRCEQFPARHWQKPRRKVHPARHPITHRNQSPTWMHRIITNRSIDINRVVSLTNVKRDDFSWHLSLLSPASSGSVLQKFKKTFFKNGKTNLPTVEHLESNETKHHRYVKQNVSKYKPLVCVALVQTTAQGIRYFNDIDKFHLLIDLARLCGDLARREGKPNRIDEISAIQVILEFKLSWITMRICQRMFRHNEAW